MSCKVILVAFLYALSRATSFVSGGVTSAGSNLRIFKQRDENGTLARTLILPKVATNWEDFDNNYILISDSNSLSTIKPTTETPRPTGVSIEQNRKRRRRKKKPEKVLQTDQRKNYFKDPKWIHIGIVRVGVQERFSSEAVR
uniref:Uncharacterized protein n=1 Tax=Rhodnius prolixus TaxID=13249 RepID=T1HVY0_RHOPR